MEIYVPLALEDCVTTNSDAPQEAEVEVMTHETDALSKANKENSPKAEDLHVPIMDELHKDEGLPRSPAEAAPTNPDLHISWMDWDFHEPHIQSEGLENYVRGGYHPVHLGDVFEARYKVVHKLGYGGLSTVWLARDNVHQRYVAIKILSAEVSSECPELEVFSYLKQSSIDHPGRRHVAFLLDHFELDGPNGTHLCLVSEVLGPSLAHLIKKDLQLRGSIARKVARQLTEAVAFLHSQGVCHGDLTPGNLALELANFDSWTEDELYSHVGEPETEAPTRESGKEIPTSVPRYIVKPVAFHIVRSELLKDSIRLIDFGIAFFVDNPPTDLGTPPSFTAPEVWFQRAAGKSTDLWALGCAIYTVRSNATMIETTWGGTPLECVGGMVELLGVPPKKWECLYFDNEGNPKSREEIPKDEDIPPWIDAKDGEAIRLPLSELAANVADEYHGPPRPKDNTPRPKGPYELEMEAQGRCIMWPEVKPNVEISSEEAELLGDLLGRLIKWEPDERTSAEVLLEHPWFVTEFEDARSASDAPSLFQS